MQIIKVATATDAEKVDRYSWSDIRSCQGRMKIKTERKKLPRAIGADMGRNRRGYY